MLKDQTLRWLKEHDQDYADQKKNKKSEYPYLTKRRELYREEKELPISNLNKYNMKQLKHHVDIEYED